jgi:hypothetical protein
MCVHSAGIAAKVTGKIFGVRSALCVRYIPGVVTRRCRPPEPAGGGARRAVGIARAILAAREPRRIACLGPQNPHKSGSAEWFPTESPRTKRHSPAHDGTDATMPLSPLTGLYAGSAGLAMLKLLVVRAGTDLLVSGRSAVRIRSPTPRSM